MLLLDGGLVPKQGRSFFVSVVLLHFLAFCHILFFRGFPQHFAFPDLFLKKLVTSPQKPFPRYSRTIPAVPAAPPLRRKIFAAPFRAFPFRAKAFLLPPPSCQGQLLAAAQCLSFLLAPLGGWQACRVTLRHGFSLCHAQHCACRILALP